MDHHCHWLGTCLGARNYHMFYWYLVHIVVLSLFEIFFIPIYLWRVHGSREARDEAEEHLLTWPEWIALPLIFIYVIAISTWICKLCYFHHCYVSTSGRTAYEMIKGHYIEYEVSPHKRGSSCMNFCLMVCCRRGIIESKMNDKLQKASDMHLE